MVSSGVLTMEQAIALGFTEEEYRKIFSQNAKDFLGL